MWTNTSFAPRARRPGIGVGHHDDDFSARPLSDQAGSGPGRSRETDCRGSTHRNGNTARYALGEQPSGPLFLRLPRDTAVREGLVR